MPVYQTDDLFGNLRQRIIEEELKPGDALVERDLSVAYGVSRTPVREALRQLVTEGLVVLDRGRGYTVRQLTVDDIVEIFIAREAVEGTLANLATAHLDDHVRIELLAIQDKMKAADPAKEPAMAIELGKQMHDLLARNAENKMLLEFYIKLRSVAALTRNLSKRTAEIEVGSREEHLVIIDSVLSGRRAEAERAMRMHLRGTCERTLSKYLSRKTSTMGA